LLQKLAAKNCEDEGGCSKYQNLGSKCSNFGSSNMENLSLDVCPGNVGCSMKGTKALH